MDDKPKEKRCIHLCEDICVCEKSDYILGFPDREDCKKCNHYESEVKNE